MPLPGIQLARSAAHAGVRRLANWYAARANSLPLGAALDRPLDRALRSAARLYARYRLPASIPLLEALCINRPRFWTAAGVRTCRGSGHRYAFRLNLADFYQRWTYFLARYHEEALELLLRRTLQRGETFMDGGANIGLVSMTAAHIVGRTGRVLAFEPSRAAFEQLDWHIRTNRISQISAHQSGLSDREEELELRIPGRDNLAAGTFATLPARYKGIVAGVCTAGLVRGDSITIPEGRPLIIKLDIEGFETRALRGLETTLSTFRPMVIVEVNREMLHATGSSVEELFSLMSGRGYRAFGFYNTRALVRRTRLIAFEVPAVSPRMPQDLAWVHPASPHWPRISRLLGPAPE
jgi:FkbM family methyltransferase